MASALAYLADVNDYQSNKMLLDMIPEQDRKSLSAKWLVNRVEILSTKSLVQNVPTLLSQMPTEKRKSERLPWENCRT